MPDTDRFTGGGRLLLGIDIGGTKTVVALGRDDGQILAESRLEHWTRGSWPADVETLVGAALELLEGARISSRQLHAVGVCAPGPLDLPDGVVLAAPNVAGWTQVPLADELQRGLGAPVRIDNDANGAALAEWRWGAGQGTRHLIYVTMSTGVGAGLILDGRLYRGHHFQAGELGHVPIVPDGRPSASGLLGVLEAYTGGAALAERIRADLAAGEPSAILALAGGDPAAISARLWVEAIRSGDGYACRLRDEFIARLAQGLAGAVMLLDPEIVVLGTIVQQNPDVFLEPLRSAVRARLWESLRDVRIEAGALGPRLPAYAGLSVALEPVPSR